MFKGTLKLSYVANELESIRIFLGHLMDDINLLQSCADSVFPLHLAGYIHAPELRTELS